MKNNNTCVVKISDIINPHFKAMWNTKRPYIICKGGRGSFKSSTISIKLAMMMYQYIIKGEQANIACIMNNQAYLHDSVYNKIKWALDMLHVSHEFKYRVNPLTIIHRATGSTFYFYGAQDPDRLKSNTINNVIAVWYEEAANFNNDQVFQTINDTFVRQKRDDADLVQIFYSYNPPKNVYSWINEWVEANQRANERDIANGRKPQYFIDHSTYLDDRLGITTPQQLRVINQYKENDEDFYKWNYLGEVTGLGTNIYNMKNFHAIKSVDEIDPIEGILFSLDTGYEVSATAYLCLGITRSRQLVLLDTYYYDPTKHGIKKAASDFAVDLRKFEKKQENKYHFYHYRRYADSATADFALDNEYMKDYGLRFKHVSKTNKFAMIGYVQNFLATGKFFYLANESSDIFIEEHKQYQWDEKSIETDNPRPIKVHDHTVDCLQYAILSERFTLGMK